jgi:hypothetical protein
MPLFKNWSAKLFKQQQGNAGDVSIDEREKHAFHVH